MKNIRNIDKILSSRLINRTVVLLTLNLKLLIPSKGPSNTLLIIKIFDNSKLVKIIYFDIIKTIYNIYDVSDLLMTCAILLVQKV